MEGPKIRCPRAWFRSSELEDDHEDPDEQQKPGCANNDPSGFLGDGDKKHEQVQYDQEAEGIDNTVGEMTAREYRLKELDDPKTDLMGKKIDEDEYLAE